MRVLVGIEGSEESDTVLVRAIDRAIEAGDRLTIAIFAKDEPTQDIDAIEARVRTALGKAELDATIHRIEGDPASELVALAERDDFDQLVIGGGEDTPLGKRFLGPITEYILLNADVTVRLER